MAKSGINFRDTIAKYTSVEKEIRGGKFAPVYLLMGEEGYFIDRISDLLATTVLNEQERAFNQIVAYGKDSEAGDIINFCRQMPMMGAYQVVILKEAQQLRKIEQLSLYTQSPSATTVLVICHKEKNLDKRSALYKHINKIGVVLESVRPRDYEIGGWLSEFVRGKGFGIEPKALTMLTDHLGSDIAKISNELDKLVTFLPEGTAAITADHIEQNIGISKDFNNFELTRAMSERNMQKALLIAEHFSRNPKDNPLLVTFSTLFSHFQRIFILNYQKWLSRNRGTAMPPDAELARMLKIPSAFFLNEYKQAASLYPNKKVFVILGLLREYDMKSKGMNAGSAGEGELLRELLMKIFLL
ncbi:MAG: DNA polymerase III subunit delta [Rikenellaceae bacterium]|nr:DNA polymerase III subunit delta [Rikenellaceae bacterium]